VLLSTELMQEPAPKQDDWWYYGKDHGQHIGFFRLRTLENLARDRGKQLLSDGHSYHLITDRQLSPRLWKFLLKRNKPISALIQRRLSSKTWPDYLLHTSGKD